MVYLIVGVTMMKRGWINRYLPPEAQRWVPDLGERWGYAWAALMFISAAINLVAAYRLPFLQWGEVMSAWALGSKITLFAVQFTTMRWIGRRRARRAMAARVGGPSRGRRGLSVQDISRPAFDREYARARNLDKPRAAA